MTNSWLRVELGLPSQVSGARNGDCVPRYRTSYAVTKSKSRAARQIAGMWPFLAEDWNRGSRAGQRAVKGLSVDSMYYIAERQRELRQSGAADCYHASATPGSIMVVGP